MSKVLAWSSLGTAFLFAAFAATALLAWDSLGAGTAKSLLLGSIVMLVISMLLAAGILVVELLAGNAEPADAAVPTAATTSSTAGSFAGFPGVEESAEPSDDAGSSADAEPLSPADTTDDDF